MTLRRISASIGGKLSSVDVVGESKELVIPCLLYLPYRQDLALKYSVLNEHYIITVQSQR